MNDMNINNSYNSNKRDLGQKKELTTTQKIKYISFYLKYPAVTLALSPFILGGCSSSSESSGPTSSTGPVDRILGVFNNKGISILEPDEAQNIIAEKTLPINKDQLLLDKILWEEAVRTIGTTSGSLPALSGVRVIFTNIQGVGKFFSGEKIIKTSNEPYVFLHEVGHATDASRGWPSLTTEFENTVLKSLNAVLGTAYTNKEALFNDANTSFDWVKNKLKSKTKNNDDINLIKFYISSLNRKPLDGLYTRVGGGLYEPYEIFSTHFQKIKENNSFAKAMSDLTSFIEDSNKRGINNQAKASGNPIEEKEDSAKEISKILKGEI